MKYFPRTTKFVDNYNDLLFCIEQLEYAPFGIDESYKEIETRAEALELSGPIFALFALENEFEELCPELKDLELYYSHWVRILSTMETRDDQWWKERKHKEFFVSLGLNSIKADSLVFTIFHLLELQDSIKRMVQAVGERYYLQVSRPQQQQNNENSGQQSTKRKNIDEETFNRALASPVMKALFHDEDALKDFLNYCVCAKSDSHIARHACEMRHKIKALSRDAVELYDELFKLKIVKFKSSTWHTAFYDGYSQ